jgi:prepilin-type N-terminal cleavage/methylation domain-containing protein
MRGLHQPKFLSLIRMHYTHRSYVAGRHGFTRVELIVVLAILGVILFLLANSPLMRTSPRAPGIACINNLKHISLAFDLYANDNEDQFPMHRWREQVALFGRNPHPLQVFAMVSDVLWTPRYLTCPTDRRETSHNWNMATESNISYFLGLDASPDLPGMLLTGDRNLAVSRDPIHAGLFPLTTNTALAWTSRMHKRRGNALTVGGAVEGLVQPDRLREIVRQQEMATNWLSIP